MGFLSNQTNNCTLFAVHFYEILKKTKNYYYGQSTTTTKKKKKS